MNFLKKLSDWKKQRNKRKQILKMKLRWLVLFIEVSSFIWCSFIWYSFGHKILAIQECSTTEIARLRVGQGFGDDYFLRTRKYSPNFRSLLTTYGCMMVNLTTSKTERPLQNPMYGVIMAWVINYDAYQEFRVRIQTIYCWCCIFATYRLLHTCSVCRIRYVISYILLCRISYRVQQLKTFNSKWYKVMVCYKCSIKNATYVYMQCTIRR